MFFCPNSSFFGKNNARNINIPQAIDNEEYNRAMVK